MTDLTAGSRGAAERTLDVSLVRVLIAEDTEFMRALVATQLRQIGFRDIAEATDGSDALAKLERVSPGLVISDISMAPMDGLAFVEALRRHPWAGAKRVPVAFLTGHTEGQYIRRAAELGVSTYFVKPVQRKQFEAQLLILLESALAHETAVADEPRRPAELRIVEAAGGEDLAAALALRYRVFIDELGFTPYGTDPDGGLGEHGDERALILVAYDGATPAGTITVDHCAATELSPELAERFHLDRFADAFGRAALYYVRKAAIAHRYRRSPLFFSLIRRVAERVYANPGARFVFLHAAPHLVPLYERLGFRRFAPHFLSPNRCGISVPLCLVVDDLEHLASARSPLLDLARAAGRVDRPEVARYFEEHWLGLDRALLAEGLAAGAPDAVGLARAARAAPVPLFDALEPAQISRLLTGCDVVRYKAREPLDIGGRADDGLLILVRGYADVTREIGGRSVSIASYGPGDVVGVGRLLLGSPQPDAPTAVTEIDAIRAPQLAFAEAASDAGLAARINLNLARIVARRLRTANDVMAALPRL